MRPQANNAWNVVIMQLGGWRSLLILVPVALVVFLLAGLMLAVLASLFVVGGTVLAARIWWLKRKLAQQPGPQTLDGDYVVLEQHSDKRERDSANAPDRHG